MSRLDIILFGATGFTGKTTLIQLHKLSKNFTWGIAGRNEEKLKEALYEAVDTKEINEISTIPIILADVEDEESIKKMTGGAKVIINCCGPFDIYGEVVVNSCIESGTHYVDVTGEVQFMNRMLNKYGTSAEEKGVFIINACGIEYILTDLGICFFEDNWQGSNLHSVESYTHIYEEDGNTLPGFGNIGTWASIIHFFSTESANFFIKQVFNKADDTILKPKLATKLLRKVENSWQCLFPSCDSAVVHRSQQYFCEKNNKKPIQYNNYLLLPSLKHVMLFVLSILTTFLIAQLKFGRKILLQYPEFFTCGLMTRNPSMDKMNRLHYETTFKCKGWDLNAPKSEGQYLIPPNKEMIGQISGSNPTYGFTSISVTLSALVILTEFKDLPEKGGVYTPAIAFSRTTLLKQLLDKAVKYKVLSTKDI